jgi:CHAD domain-containing protein
VNPTRRAFAATNLLHHLDEFMLHVPGVRAGVDIEPVHQMRVATRRLRNSLDLFEDVLPVNRSRKWNKGIKRVTRALGKARDTDVQAEFIAAFLHNVETADLAPGVQRLLLRLSQTRARLQRAVVKAMDRLESSGVVDSMRNTLGGMLVPHLDPPIAGGLPADPAEDAVALIEDARAAIADRVEEFMTFAPCVHRPELVEELHEMRKAAKHLRYTLEAYAPLFPGALEPPIKLSRKTQSLIGEIHDADVWIEQLPSFIEQERLRFADFFGSGEGFAPLAAGLEHLLANRCAHREETYRRFVAFWDDQLQSGRAFDPSDPAELSHTQPAMADRIEDKPPDPRA